MPPSPYCKAIGKRENQLLNCLTLAFVLLAEKPAIYVLRLCFRFQMRNKLAVNVEWGFSLGFAMNGYLNSII